VYKIDDLTASITWTTDEPADSVVNYGTTTSLEYTVSDSSLVTNHQINLNQLMSNTTYYFEVQSTDASDNTATDDNNGDYYTFTTFFGPEISDVDSFVSDDTWIKMNPDIKDGVLYPRERLGMVYDSAKDLMIMFGGNSLNDDYNDTWVYNYSDNTWYNKSPSIKYGTLRERFGMGLAYDSLNDRTVMFGGGYAWTNELNDTWVYNATDNTWYNMSPDYVDGTLTERMRPGMTYDSSAQRVIMYGGLDILSGIFYNETWVYNFTDNTWYNMSPVDVGGSLPECCDAELVYDSVNDLTIMFGGTASGSVRHNETWIYDFSKNTWYKQNPGFVGGTLVPRDMHSMAYDSNAERCILFGGASFGGDGELNDTWVYNSTDNIWYKVSYSMVGGVLVPRAAPGMAYDSAAGRMILFGGWNDQELPEQFTNETWTLKMDDITTTITWTTDEPSDSIVNYGTTTELGDTTSDSSLVTNHQIILTELFPDTTYLYEVQSTDQYGHTIIDDNNGNYYTFTTEQDTTPPVITNVQSSGITHNSATITWDTDEQSNSRVNYGTTIALGDTKSNSAMVTSHSIILTNLLPETTYFYEVQSTDSEGNTETDDNGEAFYTFITDCEPSNVMHVYSIDIWNTQTKNKYTIYSKVKIVDASNNAIEGATVYIDWTLHNGVVVSMSDVTDSNGEVTFIYGPTPKSGTYTTTVTDVIKSGWVYNSNDNVETSDFLIIF